MDALADLSWRIYPASALMAVGLLVFLSGIRVEVDGLRSPTGDPAKMIKVIRGFRIAVIGATVAGLGVAWNWTHISQISRMGAS